MVNQNPAQHMTRDDNPAMVEATEKLWLTAEGPDQRLVPDGHPDAAFLFCVPGDLVLASEAERLEMSAPVAEDPAQPPDTAAGQTPAGSATKETWLAHAKGVDRAKGIDVDAADWPAAAMTKAQLAEAYGAS